MPLAGSEAVICCQGNQHFFGSHSALRTLFALDLYRPSGRSQIVAGHRGKVVYASEDCPNADKDENADVCGRGFGNQVRIGHANGTVAMYAHLSRVYVRPGDDVEQGEIIGEEGATGMAGQRHLHLSLHRPSFLFGVYGEIGASVPFSVGIEDEETATSVIVASTVLKSATERPSAGNFSQSP